MYDIVSAMLACRHWVLVDGNPTVWIFSVSGGDASGEGPRVSVTPLTTQDRFANVANVTNVTTNRAQVRVFDMSGAFPGSTNVECIAVERPE